MSCSGSYSISSGYLVPTVGEIGYTGLAVNQSESIIRKHPDFERHGFSSDRFSVASGRNNRNGSSGSGINP